MRKKLRSVCASAVGRSHELRGEPCADAVEVRQFGRFRSVAVLADGAGSAPQGATGAKFAVAQTFRRLTSAYRKGLVLDEDSVRDIVILVARDIEHLAIEKGVQPAEYATTFLIVIAELRNENLIYRIAHVGDGCILAASGQESLVLSHPARGEHANETYFLTNPNLRDRIFLQEGTLSHDFAIMLMSDGTAASLYDNKSMEAAPACCVLSEWPGKVTKNQLQKAVERNIRTILRESTSDDCSLAIIKPIGVRVPRRKSFPS